ncbi:hypothetical protein AAFF_G00147450 [Aldrovandia affinis]|uniref:Secreted protein n=1 Tax=Aldrovandia affinis TaxID=143900 RepID=A0AAD7R0U1_9TELE|nr:hypothetical protein AAFF_G00147450 [Aldrovandia affinis]
MLAIALSHIIICHAITNTALCHPWAVGAQAHLEVIVILEAGRRPPHHHAGLHLHEGGGDLAATACAHRHQRRNYPRLPGTATRKELESHQNRRKRTHAPRQPMPTHAATRWVAQQPAGGPEPLTIT